MLTHRHLLSFIKIENDVHSPIIVRNDKHHSEYPLSLSCLQWWTLTGPFDFHSCNFIIGTYWLFPLMTAHFSGNWFYVQRFFAFRNTSATSWRRCSTAWTWMRKESYQKGNHNQRAEVTLNKFDALLSILHDLYRETLCIQPALVYSWGCVDVNTRSCKSLHF